MPTPESGRRGANVAAAVAFVFALGLAFLATLVLAIVGAPAGLVDAVAPLTAIFATIAFALLLVAPNLLSFAAAGKPDRRLGVRSGVCPGAWRGLLRAERR